MIFRLIIDKSRITALKTKVTANTESEEDHDPA